MFLSKFQLASLLLLLLGSCVLLTSNAEAQEVHALLVIMDDDETIGPSVQVDEENVYSFLRKVDKVYSTTKNITVLRSSAGETTVSNIQRKIRALRPGPDDVVFFYFSGHGGMISETDRRTFLLVSDPADPRSFVKLLRDDIENDVTDHNSRLQIIITDCCSNFPPHRGARKYATFAGVRTTNSMIKNLFGEHKGLLHVNGATEGQFAWGIPQTGGIFTDGLIAALSDKADLNKDKFFEWSEILKLAKENTGLRWGRLLKAGDVDPDDPQATRQTPREYSLPERLDGRHTEFHADLWDMSNRFSDLDVRFSTDKSRYRLDDLLTLTVRPDTDCYLTVLNWDTEGNLVQLFPNKFDQNNRLREGKTYQIPPRGADYEFFTTGTGIERLKIIAVTDKTASNAINKILSAPDDPDNPFRHQSVKHRSSTKAQPRFGVGEAAEKLNKQKEIAKILEDLDEDEWAEEREEVEVR